jgi:hypothetical protein
MPRTRYCGPSWTRSGSGSGGWSCGWRSWSAGPGARAVIFTDDYGEAGAINELGRGWGCRPPTSVRVAATLSNPYGVHNQEWGGHVYICTGPRQPSAQIWPQLRRYS